MDNCALVSVNNNTGESKAALYNLENLEGVFAMDDSISGTKEIVTFHPTLRVEPSTSPRCNHPETSILGHLV